MECKQFINGEWITGEGENFASQNQANLEVLWQGNAASKEQVELATRAARIALVEWRKLEYIERLKFIEKFGEILQENKEEYKEMLSKETGKPLWESEIEVESMIDKISISKNAYIERCPSKTEKLQNEVLSVRHKPHGVVAIFTPFNFPGQVANAQMVPALLAGNTVVLKPSENTPCVSELLISYCIKAGIPAGVVNLIQGDQEVGQALAQNPNLDGVFFVGSTSVGLKIQETILKYPGRIIALEMGGNNPLVVHEVDDIDAAVYATIQSAYITSGQRCTCARRLILPKTPQNEIFVSKLLEAIKNIKVGTYFDEPEPFMGPIISNQAANKILDAVSELVNNGSEVLAPVNRLDPNLSLLTPGVIDVTGIDNRIDEEIFGPVLKLIWVNSFEEAIVESNCTEYGLSAGIFTNKKENYDLFYHRIRAGLVNWNRPLTGSSEKAPFGGIGKSGNHRPSAYYSADYCSYPVSSIEAKELYLPKKLVPGIEL